MKKLLLLAMVLGLLMVGTARADGAWVLWEKDYRYAPLEWRIAEAFPSYNSCMQKEMEACGEKYEAYKGATINSCSHTLGGWVHVVGTGGLDVLRIEWKCLPESVDPRK